MADQQEIELELARLRAENAHLRTQVRSLQTLHPSQANPIAPLTPPEYPRSLPATDQPSKEAIVWGAKSIEERGRIKLGQNAFGAYAGGYAVYAALAHATHQLDPNFIPDYTDTRPPFEIDVQPSWAEKGRIVSLDPWGYMAGEGQRPTIAATVARLTLPDFAKLDVDGTIVLPGQQVVAAKIAIDPVWFLPGVADRLAVDERDLRHALHHATGGSYPQLLDRPDLKVFLPPIGGLTIYIFGPPSYLSDQSKELTLRIHDECGGSDVFGSDICTCRPYLMYGIEEAVRTAQRGGVGLIVYLRKEGRALGEVTKYLVYNARKAGLDRASEYFGTTERIAGVRDARAQALMPDALAWLGVRKIDSLVSMSDMKYDAIVRAGISVRRRYELPAELIPANGQVEIAAKIAAGYYSSQPALSAEGLSHVIGRPVEEDLVV